MKEAFRKFGIGKALFGQLGKIAQEKVWSFIPQWPAVIHYTNM